MDQYMAVEAITMQNGSLWISDDAAIIEILKRKGIFEKLTPVLGATFIVGGWEGPKAFTVVFRDYGHFKPEDNGYSMIIYPKEKFTMEQARLEWEKIIEGKREPGAPRLDMERVFAGGN